MKRFSSSLLGILAATLVVVTATSPDTLAAQTSHTEGSPWSISAVGGGSYYCIVSRCDTGLVAGGALGFRLTSNATAELGARWHHCFDCERFVIGEAGVRLHHGMARLSPFLALGGGVTADPDFFGVEWGPWAAAGSQIHLRQGWSLQLEARGRRIRKGSAMGELTLGLVRGRP
jgi:hypothetical protein